MISNRKVGGGTAGTEYRHPLLACISPYLENLRVLRLNKEFNAAVNSPDVREKFLKLGVDPLTMSLPEFEAMIKQEFESNARLIKTAGIKAN